MQSHRSQNEQTNKQTKAHEVCRVWRGLLKDHVNVHIGCVYICEESASSSIL